MAKLFYKPKSFLNGKTMSLKTYNTCVEKRFEGHNIIDDALSHTKLNRSDLEVFQPVTFEGMSFTEGSLVIKRKDGFGFSVSSRYEKAVLLFGADRIVLYKQEYSLCDEYEKETYAEVSYKDFGVASVVKRISPYIDVKNGFKKFVKHSEITLTFAGKDFTFPAGDASSYESLPLFENMLDFIKKKKAGI